MAIFYQLEDDNDLPDAPEELQGEELNVDNISTLYQAQLAVSTGSIERMVSFVGSVLGANPEAVDKLDVDQAIDEYGDPRNAEGPFADITKAKIKAGLDKRAKTPNAANNFLKTMSHMFKWAVDAELLEVSPCSGVSKLKAESDGFHTWTVEQVEQYRAKHPLGTKPRLAIDLLLFLGLRRGDVAIIGKQHVRNGVLSIRTGKNKTWVHLPIFKQLAASIEATPTGDMAFLTTEKGKPFKSSASFGNWFAKQCDAAKLPTVCRAHGLRKAGATIAADEGSTAHELMAMFGWSRLEMAQLYTREADKKKLARAASERLANKI